MLMTIINQIHPVNEGVLTLEDTYKVDVHPHQQLPGQLPEPRRARPLRLLLPQRSISEMPGGYVKLMFICLFIKHLQTNSPQSVTLKNDPSESDRQE
jgi:hypothetical protein